MKTIDSCIAIMGGSQQTQQTLSINLRWLDNRYLVASIWRGIFRDIRAKIIGKDAVYTDERALEGIAADYRHIATTLWGREHYITRILDRAMAVDCKHLIIDGITCPEELAALQAVCTNVVLIQLVNPPPKRRHPREIYETRDSDLPQQNAQGFLDLCIEVGLPDHLLAYKVQYLINAGGCKHGDLPTEPLNVGKYC